MTYFCFEFKNPSAFHNELGLHTNKNVMKSTNWVSV